MSISSALKLGAQLNQAVAGAVQDAATAARTGQLPMPDERTSPLTTAAIAQLEKMDREGTVDIPAVRDLAARVQAASMPPLPSAETIKQVAPEAYGLMCSHGPLGGKAQMRLLSEIHKAVARAATQWQATDEHNRLRRQRAYRRQVLGKLGRLRARSF